MNTLSHPTSGAVLRPFQATKRLSNLFRVSRNREVRNSCRSTSRAATASQDQRRTWKVDKCTRRKRMKMHPSQSDRAVDPLAQWRTISRRTFAAVALFSVFVNVLMLTMPIYLFQISDRVLTSRSLDTLLMLSALAVGLLGDPVAFSTSFAARCWGVWHARWRPSSAAQCWRASSCRRHRRGRDHTGASAASSGARLLSSPTMLLLFDAPLSPFYFGVIFLVHPSSAPLFCWRASSFSDRADQPDGDRRSAGTGRAFIRSKADATAESLARNSQVINAMGMLNESILHWGREQAPALTVQSHAHDRNFWISGASKFVRLVARRSSILGTGALSGPSGEITGGMMIAASIIAGRALQPLEGMIEGWRCCRSGASRLCARRPALEGSQREKSKLRLPKPPGSLSVERVLYIPPGTRRSPS